MKKFFLLLFSIGFFLSATRFAQAATSLDVLLKGIPGLPPIKFPLPTKTPPPPAVSSPSDWTGIPGFTAAWNLQDGRNDPKYGGLIPAPAPVPDTVFPYEIAGYRYGYNNFCMDDDRKCSLALETWNWEVVVSSGNQGFNLPGIGQGRGLTGHKAFLVLILNRPGSDYEWEEARPAYVDSGFMATGRMWDMSDNAITVKNQGLLRDFYLRELAYNTEGQNMGACDGTELCGSIVWIAVQRWFDGKFVLIGGGEWTRPGAGTPAGSALMEKLRQLKEKFIPGDYWNTTDEFGQPLEPLKDAQDEVVAE